MLSPKCPAPTMTCKCKCCRGLELLLSSHNSVGVALAVWPPQGREAGEVGAAQSRWVAKVLAQPWHEYHAYASLAASSNKTVAVCSRRAAAAAYTSLATGTIQDDLCLAIVLCSGPPWGCGAARQAPSVRVRSDHGHLLQYDLVPLVQHAAAVGHHLQEAVDRLPGVAREVVQVPGVVQCT